MPRPNSSLFRVCRVWKMVGGGHLPWMRAKIDLKTTSQFLAEWLSEWSRQEDQVSVTAPLPVMGTSVLRVLSDYLTRPAIGHGPPRKTESADALPLGEFFRKMAIQEIEAADCLRYSEWRKAALIHGKENDLFALRTAHLLIRREVLLFRAAARHARRWRRIPQWEMPEILPPVWAAKLSIEQLLGPIQLDRRGAPVKLTNLAFIQRGVARRLLNQQIRSPRKSEN